MEMTARLTGDAKVSTLKNDRQVVNFSVAINDSYKVKGKEEPVQVVTCVQCDFWVNPGIAAYLTKETRANPIITILLELHLNLIKGLYRPFNL